MTDKRPRKSPLLALMALALLAACNEEPTDDGRAASGEVLEGTISDAMLPLDRVQSEPPLEDPEAFAEVQEAAAADAPEAAVTDGEAEAGAADSGAANVSEAVVVPPLEPAD